MREIGEASQGAGPVEELVSTNCIAGKPPPGVNVRPSQYTGIFSPGSSSGTSVSSASAGV